MFAQVLRDLRPPWLDHSFPQALPGDGVLSRYTRPSFLSWTCLKTVATVFGQDVVDFLGQVTQHVGLDLLGVVARPVYRCTGTVANGMCMAMASMSRIFTITQERSTFLCNACAEKNLDSVDSHNVPLRALLLYALVDVESSAPSVLRMKPLRVVVHAPPDIWSWGNPINLSLIHI